MVFIHEISFQKKLYDWLFCNTLWKKLWTFCKYFAIILLIVFIILSLAFIVYFYWPKKIQNIPEKTPEFNHTVKPDHNHTNQLVLELLVAVDRTMKDFHNENLHSYLEELSSMASNVYADASIGGNSIQISITNIIELNGFQRAANESAYNSQLLNKFCDKVAKSDYHYDAAIFMTRDRICSNDCKAIGLAFTGSVCTRKSCALVQDTGLPTAVTMAHELGHILGMPHDNDERCKNFVKPGGDKQVMHTQMSYDMHPWSWSDCSRHYLFETLEQEHGTCLEDTHSPVSANYKNPRLQGEIYSIDKQCELAFGIHSHSCHMSSSCKRLWCKNSNDKSCRSNNFPWADGTPCNINNSSYSCQQGECLPREGHKRNVVNGGWGPWSPWSPCSLACGGGIQKSLRWCNNPVAKNGGKYCSGVGKKYRSCNTQSCPPGSMDAREEQCYRKNGIRLNITGIGPNTKWIPKFDATHDHQCDLYCHAQGSFTNFHFPEKVIDGTSCSLDSFDKCVNGVCRPAGCDNQLNSIAKIDKCGICEGRNDTCEDVTGSFLVSDLYKVRPIYKNVYYPVTIIPKGATNIIIKQPNFPEENHIVLKDDNGNWLLNGNLIVTPFHEVGYYAGVTYNYSGNKVPVEKVSTSYGRKLRSDLLVEILSYTRFQPESLRDIDTILLTYSYSIDKSKIVELNKKGFKLKKNN